MWLLAMCLAPEDSQLLFQAYEKAECSPAAGIPMCLDTMQHRLSIVRRIIACAAGAISPSTQTLRAEAQALLQLKSLDQLPTHEGAPCMSAGVQGQHGSSTVSGLQDACLTELYCLPCRAHLPKHADTECRSAGAAAAEVSGSGTGAPEWRSAICECRQGSKQQPGGSQGPVHTRPDLHKYRGD